MTKRDSSASAARAARGTDSKDSRAKRSLDLKIETAPVASLRAYEKNARTHSDKQVAQIRASIERFGFVNPILVDDDNVVIAGHGRLEAAKLLGMAEAPIARLSHLTPAEVRAYRLADNKLAELSGWDQDLLRIELGALVEIDFDIELTGFATPEIDLLLEPTGAESASKPAPDDALVAPDQKMAAVSRTGDLWELGKHRLICGDALAPETYAALMGDERADMVMTDPPYNVRVDGHVSGLGKVRHREFAMASGEMTPAEFQSFLDAIVGRLAERSRKGAVLDLCMDWRSVFELLSSVRKSGLELLNICVWNKTNGGMGSLYRSKHELVVVAKKPGAGHINNVELGKHGRYRTNVWDYAGANAFRAGRDEDLETHPTVKPVGLVADAIRDVTHVGDLVLDPFCGSGTILLAAERTKRRARAIEIDPLYVDAAIRRFEKATGLTARLASTGETFTEIAAKRLSEEEPSDPPSPSPKQTSDALSHIRVRTRRAPEASPVMRVRSRLDAALVR